MSEGAGAKRHDHGVNASGFQRSSFGTRRVVGGVCVNTSCQTKYVSNEKKQVRDENKKDKSKR